MSNFGIKISNPSYNVNTAADYQLLFNSSWPSIAIAYEGTISVPYTNSTSVTLTHNLGFYPLTMCWMVINGQNIYNFFQFGGGQSQTSTAHSVSTTKVIANWAWDSSTASIAFPYGYDPFGNYMDGSLTATIHVKCYNIDLSKDADYTAPHPATTKVPYDSNYGIKIAKPDKNVNSRDLRDFILHSRAQSPAILSVLTQDKGTPDPSLDGNTLITYTNPAGYVGWFFGYQKANFGTPTNPNIRYASIPVQPSNANQAGADISAAGTYQLSVPSDPGGTMVVLRDPLFASNNIFVSY